MDFRYRSRFCMRLIGRRGTGLNITGGWDTSFDENLENAERMRKVIVEMNTLQSIVCINFFLCQ